LPGGGGRAQRLLVQSTAAHGAMGLMPDPMLQTMQMKNVPTWQYFDVLVARHGFTADQDKNTTHKREKRKE